MSKKISFKWRCPKCERMNHWEWDKWDILCWLNSSGVMTCGMCGKNTRMSLEFIKVKE